MKSKAAKASHRTTLKQTNKSHNKLGHKSKGQYKALVKGKEKDQ